MKPAVSAKILTTTALLMLLAMTACSSDSDSDNDDETANSENGSSSENGTENGSSDGSSNGTENGTDETDTDNELIFSGDGASDPASSLTPGTMFIPVSYEEAFFETTLTTISWEDGNGTVVAVFPNSQDSSKAGLVSITLDGNVGGTAWLSTDGDGDVDGTDITANSVMFVDTEVSDPTVTSTMITINGNLIRQVP